MAARALLRNRLNRWKELLIRAALVTCDLNKGNGVPG